MLVTVIAQFTVKTTNSVKAIYFLSLMSCSINKLKYQMFFTCKNFFFFFFFFWVWVHWLKKENF